MPIPAALAGDLNEAREHVTQLTTERASAMEAADKLVEDTKAKIDGFNHLVAASAAPDSPEHQAFLDIDAAYKAADQLGDKIAEINATIAKHASAEGKPIAGGDPLASFEAKAASFGERIVANPEYQALRQAGRFTTSGRVDMPFMELASQDELRHFLDTGVFTAASDGSGLVPVDQRLDMPVGIPIRRPRLLDLITVASTETEKVEWSYQTTRTPGAAPTAANAASGETVLVWDKTSADVVRIPTHAIIPKAQLADAARMRTEVDPELRRAITLETERQILNGDGTGDNFTGILNTAGIASVAKGGDTIGDAVHKGITAVRIALEDDITAVGVHPNDYQRYVLAKDSNQNYLSGRGPQDATAPTIWGYPAIVSTVFTEGEAVPANWAWAYLWIRAGITIEQGYINDQLIKDLTTLAAEYRAAFGVKQAKAFAKVTGLNA